MGNDYGPGYVRHEMGLTELPSGKICVNFFLGCTDGNVSFSPTITVKEAEDLAQRLLAMAQDIRLAAKLKEDQETIQAEQQYVRNTAKRAAAEW